jgi:hypothetical protein
MLLLLQKAKKPGFAAPGEAEAPSLTEKPGF